MTYDHTDALRSPMMTVPKMGTNVPHPVTPEPDPNEMTATDVTTLLQMIEESHG